jgi:hypothetical protein
MAGAIENGIAGIVWNFSSLKAITMHDTLDVTKPLIFFLPGDQGYLFQITIVAAPQARA